MSDLVKRLRAKLGDDLPSKWEVEAADRIEQLEAALQENQNYIIEHCDSYHAASLIRRNRAALAPEQDR